MLQQVLRGRARAGKMQLAVSLKTAIVNILCKIDNTATVRYSRQSDAVLNCSHGPIC